jgi:hypothetical protein
MCSPSMFARFVRRYSYLLCFPLPSHVKSHCCTSKYQYEKWLDETSLSRADSRWWDSDRSSLNFNCPINYIQSCQDYTPLELLPSANAESDHSSADVHPSYPSSSTRFNILPQYTLWSHTERVTATISCTRTRCSCKIHG